MPDEFDKEFWEGHYRGHPGAHDGGGPNPSLVTEAGNLPPGRALDAATAPTPSGSPPAAGR